MQEEFSAVGSILDFVLTLAFSVAVAAVFMVGAGYLLGLGWSMAQ